LRKFEKLQVADSGRQRSPKVRKIRCVKNVTRNLAYHTNHAGKETAVKAGLAFCQLETSACGMNMKDKIAALCVHEKKMRTEAEIETIEFTHFDSFEWTVCAKPGTL